MGFYNKYFSNYPDNKARIEMPSENMLRYGMFKFNKCVSCCTILRYSNKTDITIEFLLDTLISVWTNEGIYNSAFISWN